MNRKLFVTWVATALTPACSSNDRSTAPDAADAAGFHADAAADASTVDASPVDALADTSIADGPDVVVNAADATPLSDAAAATDAGPDATEADAGSDAAPGIDACAGWTSEPAVDALLVPPPDAGGVLLHAAASGTQDYTCSQRADGGYGWTFTGPEATLMDCSGTAIGRHFAGDGGPGAPEWLVTSDGSYVIAQKVASLDAGAASVPWLLLKAIGQSDGGALAATTYVQRLWTDGGVAPAAGCQADSGAIGVPYRADYFFYGP